MKTVSKQNEIVRVNDAEATLRSKSGWKYVPKTEWKEKVRDLNKKEKVDIQKTEKIKKEKH